MAGDGTYVDVEDGIVDDVDAGWVGGRNLILEKWDQTFTTIATLQADVLTALDELQDLQLQELPAGWQDILRGVTIDDITHISESDREVIPTLELPDNWPTDIPILGVLKSVPNVDLSYDKPTEPDDVDPTVNYKEGSFVSPIIESLFDKVYDTLENGGTGIDSDIEDAIKERGRQRLRISNDREWQRSINAVSPDGFDFAGGAEVALLGQSSAEILQQEENLENDILIKSFDLAQLNTHFMTDKAVALENIYRAFHNAKEDRTLRAEVEIARFVLQKYSEKIRAYIAKWDGVKTELMAKVETVNVALKQNELIGGIFKTEMDGFLGRTEAVSKRQDGLVAGYKGQIDGIKARVDEKKAWWDALNAEQKTNVERNRLELEKALSEVKAMLDGTISLNSLKERITESIANITAQVLASALTAVNTSVTHGTSKSEQLSESYGHRDSISESHDFNDI